MTALLLTLGLSLIANAETTEELERKLPNAMGLARIQLLAQLVDGQRNSKPDAAVRYAKEGLRLLDKQPNPKLRVDILNEMSWAYRVLGEHSEALRIANESVAIARQNDYGKGLARAFNNVGGVYYFLGDYELALENSLKALEIREASDDLEGIGASLSNIGLLQFNLGNNNAAIEAFLKALEISQQTGNAEYRVNHLHNLAEVYIKIGKNEEAIAQLLSGLEIAQQTDYAKGECDALKSLGVATLNSGKLDEAEDYLKSALLLAETIGWRSLQAEVRYNLAQLKLVQDRPDQALSWAVGALDIANVLAERDIQIRLHQQISTISEDLGNHREALSHYKLYSDLQAEQFKQERQDKITRLQLGREVTEKNRELDLLRKDQAIRDLELEASKTRQRDWQLGALGLAVFAVLLFGAYRQRLKDLNRRSTIAENYDKLLSSLPLGVMAVDGNGDVTFMNDALARITERQQTSLELLKGHAFTLQMKEQEVDNWDLAMVSGPPKSLLLAVSQRLDERGQPAGFWLIATDLTEQKQTYAQLIQASKLATLGEMSTGMAHELNQPLNVISLATSNLRFAAERGRNTTESLITKLDRIEGAVSRAASIIDHMRAYGRVAGDNFTQIDVCDVVKNACHLLQESLALQSIQLIKDLPDTEMIIMGNAIQLEQVVLNLINNAKDAITSNSNEGRITVSADIKAGRAHLKVTDTGGGIPEEVLPHLFEPFFTTKPVGKGTGLGGSISYGIVRDMQGDIWAENVDGGAQLNVSLPLHI